MCGAAVPAPRSPLPALGMPGGIADFHSHELLKMIHRNAAEAERERCMASSCAREDQSGRLRIETSMAEGTEGPFRGLLVISSCIVGIQKGINTMTKL